MEVISLIGFLVFLGSLIYLVYHFIRKFKNRERVIPKKRFYLALIGGFLLFLITGQFIDTSIQDELNEALDTNTVLAAENEDFKSSIKALEADNKKLTEENQVTNEEIEELKIKLKDFDEIKKELSNKETSHKEEKEALEKQITELNEKNSKLVTEVEGLKKKVASNSTQSTASSSNQSSGTSTSSGGGSSSKSSTSSSSANTSQSGGNVYYKNCSEARAAGAAPVRRGEPGYGKHLDRDGDGIGCE